MFFVSVASKGLKYCASPLFATHGRWSASVASKGVISSEFGCVHESWFAGHTPKGGFGSGLRKVEAVGRPAGLGEIGRSSARQDESGNGGGWSRKSHADLPEKNCVT